MDSNNRISLPNFVNNRPFVQNVKADKYINRRKGNRKNIPTIKDYNGGHISDPIGKANSPNNYYAFIFACERDIPKINSTYSGKPFTIIISSIKRRLAMIWRNKSVGPDYIPGETLKMGGGGSHDSVPGSIARHNDKQLNYTKRLEKSHNGFYS
jgi:hypothetical protein